MSWRHPQIAAAEAAEGLSRINTLEAKQCAMVLKKPAYRDEETPLSTWDKSDTDAPGTPLKLKLEVRPQHR